MLKALRYAAANLLALACNLFPKAALRPVEETVIHINAIFFKKIPGQEKFRNYKIITPISALVN